MNTISFTCSLCGKRYDPASFIWRCMCGGLLDLTDYPVALPIAAVHTRPATLWRYREALPFTPADDSWQAVTMGEGMTPLVSFGQAHPQALLKVEYAMPSLSFKDRGAAVLVAKVRALGATHLIADSSGNAGTAIAAYAARASLACDVYVPASSSAKKLQQIAAHGATLHLIAGTREDVAAAAIAAVAHGDGYYASHVYNPFFFAGTKTYAYEIWEQLDYTMPPALIVPVGNGTLLLGIYYGCRDLLGLGLIATMPRIIAIQAARCAPLAQAFAAGESEAAPVTNQGTVAEGIAIAAPARHRQILAAVRDTAGAILAVPEHTIAPARQTLAACGFYVEPTAAINWAGYQMAREGGLLAADAQVVIPLCGAGIKSG